MRVPMILATAVLLGSSTALAADGVYGWTISSSSTDPYVNSGPSAGGVVFLKLWLLCSTDGGMSAAEFDLGGTMTVFGFDPANGFLNAGSGAHMLLAVGGCPEGAVVAGNVIVADYVPSEVCFLPSAANGLNVTVDCSANPSLHPNQTIGYSTAGGPSCRDGDSLCQVFSVEDATWGRIKTIYR